MNEMVTKKLKLIWTHIGFHISLYSVSIRIGIYIDMKTDMGSYRFELIYGTKCLDWEGLIGRGLMGDLGSILISILKPIWTHIGPHIGFEIDMKIDLNSDQISKLIWTHISFHISFEIDMKTDMNLYQFVKLIWDTRSLSPRKCSANILRTSSFQCIFISESTVAPTPLFLHLIRLLKPFSKSILQCKIE